MEYHLLAETADGSGTYEATGEVLSGSLEEAAAEAVARTQAGHRHAVYVLDTINRRAEASGVGTAVAAVEEEPRA